MYKLQFSYTHLQTHTRRCAGTHNTRLSGATGAWGCWGGQLNRPSAHRLRRFPHPSCWYNTHNRETRAHRHTLCSCSRTDTRLLTLAGKWPPLGDVSDSDYSVLRAALLLTESLIEAPTCCTQAGGALAPRWCHTRSSTFSQRVRTSRAGLSRSP